MATMIVLARTNLARLVNNRVTIFVAIVLPVIVMFSMSPSKSEPPEGIVIGVVDEIGAPGSGAVRGAIADREGISEIEYADAHALRRDVIEGAIDAGWVVAGQVEDCEGRSVGEIRPICPGASSVVIYWVGGNKSVDGLFNVLELEARSIPSWDTAARYVSDKAETTIQEGDELLGSAYSPQTEVASTVIRTADDVNPGNQRGVAVAGQLVFLVFLLSLTGGASLFFARKPNAVQQVQADRSQAAAISISESVVPALTALTQATIMVIGSWVLRGVDWGSPGAVLTLAMAMSLVGAGAAVLVGALARTAQQVLVAGVSLSAILGVLGGSMMPLEFFPDTVRRVSFAITPHAWMNDALWRILVDGQGIGDVWGALAVLVGVGIALIAAATVVMARSLR